MLESNSRRFSLSRSTCSALLFLFFLLAVVGLSRGSHAAGPQMTWHWHQHQPIYWNGEDRTPGEDRYEYAWESIQMKDGGDPYPTNNLRDIFGKDDRVAAYQYRMRDSLNTIGGHTSSGVTVSYSAALMENIGSLGSAGQLGYSGGWRDPINEAIGWTTPQGSRRLDMVNFSGHHGLTGLLHPETVEMELRLWQQKYSEVFPGQPLSKGFFPTELTFSTRLIPTLRDVGVEWSYVSGEHIARAMPNFPLQLGSGGVNCEPPNRADQINAPGTSFIRNSIDRGCSPVNANPESFRPAYVQYVDPATGAVERIIAVPVDQAWSWKDGYSPINAQILDDIAAANDPNHPSLVVLCHDGDNAYGGGFSYYMENVQNLANDANGRAGGEAGVTTTQGYLNTWSVDTNNVIHVEDGGWVNADSDFGSPTFINWNYPLILSTGQVDVINGWHEKARDMGIFTATLNRILTAQQISGHTPNMAHVLNPNGSTHPVDRAWHYHLGSLDSGNVYYGPAEDFEIKASMGANLASDRIAAIMSDVSGDTTPPTIWVPQRWPYNPGSLNFGVGHGYTEYHDDGDFDIWTFIYDVNGPADAVLKYRVDNDGVNPLASTQNEVYDDAGANTETGAWVSLPMNRRAFDADQPAGYNNGAIDQFIVADHIADHYSVSVTGLRDVMIDYYVEATDSKGNIARSPIQHVYVGDGSGSTGGPGGAVTTLPEPPQRGQQVTITYDATGRALDGAGTVNVHLGKNNWVDPPGASDFAMTSEGSNVWSYTYTVDADATNICMVFNNGAGTWDNNGGADWILTTTEGGGAPTAAFSATPLGGNAPLQVSFTDTSLGSPTAWEWDFDNDGSTDSTSQNPTHTFTTPGQYSVKLTVTNATDSDEELKTNYINATQGPTDPEITLAPGGLTPSVVVGNNAAAETFTVTNTGAGTLSYTINISGQAADSGDIMDYLLGISNNPAGLDTNGDTMVNVADLVTNVNSGGTSVGWLSVNPTSGDSTGESDTIDVTYATTGLAAGTYSATIVVTGNAPNSPQSIPVTLTVSESLPDTTTVVPNPPTQGQAARVWYASSAGPISGAGQYNLHWGINGGLVAGGTWEDVTSTPMTDAGSGGMWYADITIPANATTLNFVTNDGNENWDNNSGADWNFAVNPAGGSPSILLSTSSISTSGTAGGANPTADTFTVTNDGGGTLSYSVAVQDTTPPAPAATFGPTGRGGSRKTITIDGVNTSGEWTETERIVTAPAWDHANVVGGNWSTHETQFDYTGLYGAWDDDYLYVAIQIVDVVDIEDPANAGSSQGTAPTQMNLPQFIGIDVRPGGYGNPAVLSDMWTKAHGFNGGEEIDYQVYFASNFWQGPFVCEYQAGWDPDNDAYGPFDQIYQDHTGLAGASSKHDAGGPIIGPGGRNYRTDGTDAANRSSFFEVRVPLELIGNPDLDTQSIGLFVGHGEGFSGVDTMPKDPAATDTPGVSESNSPNEWTDPDIYTVPFARVGTGGGGPSPWISVNPTSGSSTGEADTITVTYDTSGLSAGTYTATITVTDAGADDSPQTIDVTLNLSAGGGDPALLVSPQSLSATINEGQSATGQSFAIENSGGGTLSYSITANDTGDGTSWFSVSPTSGTSTGESDTINVTFPGSSSLAAGSYAATLTVTGNAPESPVTVNISLTVNEVTIPSTTTVDPNPAIAGQTARVWYASSVGPISGAAGYVLHWGINNWTSNITDTPMTDAGSGGMWYADIAIPANATQLDFVTNDGNNNWDNNGGNDWHFTVTASATPIISLSRVTVNASTPVGADPSDETFTISNGGPGTMNYSLAKVDTGDGTSWFSINPASGSSTGEADTITVSFAASALAEGIYVAGLAVSSPDATNSPRDLTVQLQVTGSNPVPPITIGAGPIKGTNTEGTSYNEEFQDWTFGDLRALDNIAAGGDSIANLGDGFDGSRDIVALYSRFESGNAYFRVDLYELGIFAENGNVDVYVLIDCASGGTTSLPNGITGATTPTPWNVAAAAYDATNGAAISSGGTADTGAFLGGYFRSDLDSMEFGISGSALTAAGWDGTSPVRLYAITGKDSTTTLGDRLGFDSTVTSESTTGRGKFAIIAHGNQSLNRGDSMRDRLYISGANTGVGAPSGFSMTLDTHEIFQIPLNIHMSGTLISAIGWIKDADPNRDGQTFLSRVGEFVDEDQTHDPGAKIGGVFSEHIMPFFNGPINQVSIEQFDNMTRDLWNIDGGDMKVMHIPERVTNSVAAASGRDPFDDIVDSAYVATYIDEVAHYRDWLSAQDNGGSIDDWTGIGGGYGVPRHHKLHIINGVYTFLINDMEDQYKFWPQDDGANANWRQNLLYKALDADQAQLTLIFDDWEALAGYSFGSGYNNNAVQYNQVMRWVANKPWIEVVTLKEVFDRATNTGNPNYDAGWVFADRGDIGDHGFNTYDYLHHATEDSYENWYYGSATEESFRNAVPVVDGIVGSGTAMPSGKVFGDIASPGTIIYDTWAAVEAAPQGNLRELAERAYVSMIYETAWHDEDNTNYERNAGTNYTTWSFPDTTYDRVSGWLFTLANHLRTVTVTTTAAQWAANVKAGLVTGVTNSSSDLDQDGQLEYILFNDRLWFAFEARGGRCIQAYFYDPTSEEAYSFLGTSPINNPTGQGEEEGTTTASRCSGFKEMNDGIYADAIYSASLGTGSLTFTSPNGLVTKVISLSGNTATVDYTNNTGGDLYTRMGVSVNNLDLLHNGQNFTSNYTSAVFSQTNATRGSVTFTGTSNATTNQLDDYTRFIIPLTEQMEMVLGTGASQFTITAQ